MSATVAAATHRQNGQRGVRLEEFEPFPVRRDAKCAPVVHSALTRTSPGAVIATDAAFLQNDVIAMAPGALFAMIGW